MFPTVRAMNVIKTRRRGEAPLSSENFPIAKYESNITTTPAITQVMSAERNTIKIPVASYFGGPRSSSVVRLSMFSVIVAIRKKYEECSYRYEYICKVQNGKIFHCNEVYDMSDKNTFIGM